MDVSVFIISLMLAFARISSFLFYVPFMRANYIPNTSKVVISFALAIFATGEIGSVQIGSTIEFVLLVILQIVIGLTLAFFVEMFFQIAQMAGSLMDYDMGLAMAEVVDPSSGRRITVMSSIFNILFVVVFISVGGVQTLVLNILYSFRFTEYGYFLGEAGFIDLLLAVFLYMITAAIQIALPFMATVFVINFIFLIIGRASPQINIFANMFIVKIAFGIVFFLVAVPLLSEVFMQINEVMSEELFEVMDVILTK